MKNSTKNIKFDVLGLTTNNQIIKQQTLTIAEHQAQTKYLMLAKNNFVRKEPVYCPGYFNRKTNFIIGEVQSLIAIDKKLNIITGEASNTSNLIGSEYFMLYPIPCFQMERNATLDYEDSETGTITKIVLDWHAGYSIGLILSGQEQSKFDFHPGFLSLLINTKNGISLNKNILLNSNYKFVLGILEGYYDNNDQAGFFINNNVNIYTFTTILNYLGASYSIRNAENNTKKLFIQLPLIFKEIINNKFIKTEQYGFNSLDNELQIVNEIIYFDKEPTNLSEVINSGKVLAIPYSSLTFERLLDDDTQRMYDLTSEREDATNYAMSFTPLLKNSDGDILAISGIFTKEGLSSAQEFSPEVREYYKNLNDGEINNWIADDAILGLYNSTSQLSKKK